MSVRESYIESIYMMVIKTILNSIIIPFLINNLVPSLAKEWRFTCYMMAR